MRANLNHDAVEDVGPETREQIGTLSAKVLETVEMLTEQGQSWRERKESYLAGSARLDQLITGVIAGWSSPTIQSRVPGVETWTSGDGSAAILSVLGGHANLSEHGKIVLVPQLQA
jgi:hypothetical protein